MTAEVAIMNQRALVMAADSAATSTIMIGDEPQTRHLGGATKLFQLSAHHPVGVMIYGSASLHDVPSEILIKDFRGYLGADCCDHLNGYSQRLFEFVQNHPTMLPRARQRQLFFEQVAQAALKVVRDSAALEELLVRLQAAAPEAPIAATKVERAVEAHTEAVSIMIVDEIARFGLADARIAPVLAEVAIRELMVNYRNYLPCTGIVVGGYGKNDYYPGIEEFECRGFLDRQFLHAVKGATTIVSGDPRGAIVPFATTSMTETFSFGIGPDIYEEVIQATGDELRGIARTVQKALAPDQPAANLETFVGEAALRHWKRLRQRSLNDHYSPLTGLVELLPASGIVALPRSLIELQCLKEWVTKPNASVTGPVDVAIITRHDGFVWCEQFVHQSEENIRERAGFV